jgi:hypothetical protein
VSLLIEDHDWTVGDQGRHPLPHRVGGQEGSGNEQQLHRLLGAQLIVRFVVELEGTDLLTEG